MDISITKMTIIYMTLHIFYRSFNDKPNGNKIGRGMNTKKHISIKILVRQQHRAEKNLLKLPSKLYC